MQLMTRKDWASKDAIMQEVADVPENWLRAFAVRHPTDCRKFATTRNGSMMYRVEAVLKAIEDGEGMPNGGIRTAVYKGEDKGEDKGTTLIDGSATANVSADELRSIAQRAAKRSMARKAVA